MASSSSSDEESESEAKAEELDEVDAERLAAQARRPMPAAEARRFQEGAARHWDLFYKRNGDRFFKRRRWIEREFAELFAQQEEEKVLLEMGCGCGDLALALVEAHCSYRVLACDLSPRAVALLRGHPLYDETKIRAFVASISSESQMRAEVPDGSCSAATLVFALSALPPGEFVTCLKNAHAALREGGFVLFRDYARHDRAQLRFKPGRMIADNFYARQDGTLSYFFELDELVRLFAEAGFRKEKAEYVRRRTVNKKRDLDVARLFLQAKFVKVAR